MFITPYIHSHHFEGLMYWTICDDSPETLILLVHTLCVNLAHVVPNENASLLKYAKYHAFTVFVQLHGVYSSSALRTALECVSVM